MFLCLKFLSIKNCLPFFLGMDLWHLLGARLDNVYKTNKKRMMLYLVITWVCIFKEVIRILYLFWVCVHPRLSLTTSESNTCNTNVYISKLKQINLEYTCKVCILQHLTYLRLGWLWSFREGFHTSPCI